MSVLTLHQLCQPNKFNIDNDKFPFNWLKKADPKSTLFVTLDEQSVCKNILWLTCRLFVNNLRNIIEFCHWDVL